MAASKLKHSQWCGAINCRNSRVKCPSLSFFRFPKEKERCRKWVVNTRRADLADKSPQYLYRSVVLCQDHFEDNQFMNSSIKNKLIPQALPTIFAVHNPPKSTQLSRPTHRKRPAPDDLQTDIHPTKRSKHSGLGHRSTLSLSEAPGSSAECPTPASSTPGPRSRQATPSPRKLKLKQKTQPDSQQVAS